jgi:hypothetical protein
MRAAGHIRGSLISFLNLVKLQGFATNFSLRVPRRADVLMWTSASYLIWKHPHQSAPRVFNHPCYTRGIWKLLKIECE